MDNTKVDLDLDSNTPVWDWFELSYASYVAIPRIVLQAMPIKWQKDFVKLMDELDNTIDWRRNHCYIQYRDSKGRFLKKDPFSNYRHYQPSIKEINKIVKEHNGED